MSYIQKLIDTQENNIIIICDKNYKPKYVNKTFYKFFKKKRLQEIINFVRKEKTLNKRVELINYKKETYRFVANIEKVEDDITITLSDITKTSAYKKSLINSNLTFVEYKTLVEKFLIISKTDTKGIITYVNDNFIKISGYSKDELIGKPHNIVRDKSMPKYLFRNMWKTIQNGKIWNGVIRNRKKNGDYYYVKTMVAPLFDSKNNIREYIAFRVDITELIKAKEEAQKAKRAKEIFLANMSHEIRTPLTGVIGFIDILKRKNLPEDIKSIINIIDNSADMLLNIVNDILDLSKIETEGVVIHKHKFNPKVSFQNTIELFKARANEKKINYISNIDINSCIISDEYRLKQVLSNLIGNSIKFTPENGEVRVDIASQELQDGKIRVNFSVSDNGIGIPKEKQNRLFKLFSQIDSQKFGGTGLGLYISAQIVSKLGGKLQVKSEENKGSKFYFSLDFEVCDEIKKKEYKDEINVKGKILIVEDNVVNQELLKALLDIKGDIEYKIANNGKEAIEIFKKENFDLIFMDIFMPILDGTKATKEIIEYENKNNLPHTPIIALTANVLSGDKEKFLSQGFNDYLSKPIKNRELDAILNKYLKSNVLSKIASSLDLEEDVVKQLIKLYFENIYEDLNNLEKAINKKDMEEIRKIAHKIAGSSGAVRFEDIYKLSKQLELNAKEKNEIDYLSLFIQIKELIEKYKQDVDFVESKNSKKG